MTNLEKLLTLLGLQGGTLHQVSELTGLTLTQILNLESIPYTSFESVSEIKGSVAFTHSTEYMRDEIVKTHKGDLDYWKSAIKSLKLKEFI